MFIWVNLYNCLVFIVVVVYHTPVPLNNKLYNYGYDLRVCGAVCVSRHARCIQYTVRRAVCAVCVMSDELVC